MVTEHAEPKKASETRPSLRFLYPEITRILKGSPTPTDWRAVEEGWVCELRPQETAAGFIRRDLLRVATLRGLDVPKVSATEDLHFNDPHLGSNYRVIHLTEVEAPTQTSKKALAGQLDPTNLADQPYICRAVETGLSCLLSDTALEWGLKQRTAKLLADAYSYPVLQSLDLPRIAKHYPYILATYEDLQGLDRDYWGTHELLRELAQLFVQQGLAQQAKLKNPCP